MKPVLVVTPLVAVLLLVSACAPAPSSEPIATMEQLMEGMIQPLSERVWDSVQTVVDLEGVHARPEVGL